MSGFEIAGLVLGAFPILLKSLEHYREGFEPLEEWWNFRTHFIAFVDDIRHQMMRYNENLVRLLDPIIADTDELASLLRDSSLADARWHDGTFEGPLKQRLASECDRFLRILRRMQEVMEDLGKLLQIDNGNVGTSYTRPSCSLLVIHFRFDNDDSICSICLWAPSYVPPFLILFLFFPCLRKSYPHLPTHVSFVSKFRYC